eukprot:TRINITY_DN12454_c0_g1_i4.p1 TRINITY_DN12454_c0_g1~~TRINITY_DN12454_c0_g1_i4.p1  ORF type:complete len:493 (-),score=53.70 TRINITY_DN12454_c0_g1_i4:63-1541(-)
MRVQHAFGVCSPRYVTILPVRQENEGDEDSSLVDIGLSTGVARWDVARQRRVDFKVYHDTTVTGIVEKLVAGRWLVFTSSHGGEVASWDRATCTQLGHVHVNVRAIMHIGVQVAGDSCLIIVSSEDKEGQASIVSMAPSGALALQDEIRGNYTYCEFTSDGAHIIAVEQPQARHPATENRAVSLVLLDLKGHEISRIHLGDTDPINTVAQDEEHGQLAYARGRHLRVVSRSTPLAVLWCVQANGSGTIKDMILEGDSLLVPSSGGVLSWWGRGKDEPLAQCKGSHGVVYAMRWSHATRRTALWICDEGGVRLVRVEGLDPPSTPCLEVLHQVTFHEMTCCGIDFNPRGDAVACGDFMGNVMVWRLDGQHFEPAYRTSIGVPVRSLLWCKGGTDDIHGLGIYVGGLDGTLYHWTVHDDKLTIHSTLKGTITVLCQHPLHPSLICAGTTEGFMYIFNGSQELYSFLAHKPDGHLLQLRLPRYLIEFDPLTIVLD